MTQLNNESLIPLSGEADDFHELEAASREAAETQFGASFDAPAN